MILSLLWNKNSSVSLNLIWELLPCNRLLYSLKRIGWPAVWTDQFQSSLLPCMLSISCPLCISARSWGFSIPEPQKLLIIILEFCANKWFYIARWLQKWEELNHIALVCHIMHRNTPSPFLPSILSSNSLGLSHGAIYLIPQ